EVYTVAPDREQSAVSHSLTLHRPLRIEELASRRFAVNGTPTDCINLAIKGFLPIRPQLVVSGINKGANLGDDITYSGTVSAAIEGSLLGIPSIAVSLVAPDPPYHFGAAAAFAAILATEVLAQGMPSDTLLNVNVPNLSREQIKGFLLTRQGKRRYAETIEARVDPRGKKYYWIGGDDLGFDPAEGTDCVAVHEGFISVTPLHVDLTNYRAFQELRDLKLPWH
ncbi:MAG: 5'/3'-nucleotidase SurE, partial [Candidatus Binatia bacterium]